MTAFYMLKDSSKALPELFDINKLRMFQKDLDERGATFLEDMMILAIKTGNASVFKIVRKVYRRFQILEAIAMLDRYMFGGVLRRFYYRVRRPKWFDERVSLKGPNPWDL